MLCSMHLWVEANFIQVVEKLWIMEGDEMSEDSQVL